LGRKEGEAFVPLWTNKTRLIPREVRIDVSSRKRKWTPVVLKREERGELAGKGEHNTEEGCGDLCPGQEGGVDHTEERKKTRRRKERIPLRKIALAVGGFNSQEGQARGF